MIIIIFTSSSSSLAFVLVYVCVISFFFIFCCCCYRWSVSIRIIELARSAINNFFPIYLFQFLPHKRKKKFHQKLTIITSSKKKNKIMFLCVCFKIMIQKQTRKLSDDQGIHTTETITKIKKKKKWRKISQKTNDWWWTICKIEFSLLNWFKS